MYTVVSIAKLIDELKARYLNHELTLSEACWMLSLACEGWAYVFGAWGAECTVAERKKRYNAHPSHTTIKTACKAFNGGSCSGCKWFPDGERTRCFDCRGFTDWCIKQFLELTGFDLQGEGATSQWNTASNWCAKGKVSDGVPQNVLVNLFYEDKDDPKTMSHTGFGFNGETCECSNNVQHFLKMNKKWTKWAVAKCFAADLGNVPVPETPVQQPVEDGKTNKYPKLKKGDKGDAVRYLQTILLNLGYSLPKYGADGDFGNETLKAVKAFQKDWGLAEDGVVGEKTWERLITAPEKPKFYTVTITHLTKEQADEIVNKYGGSVVAE